MSAEKIGTVGVDAGCVQIGDPCYTMFKRYRKEPAIACIEGEDIPEAEEDWLRFCKEMEFGGQFLQGYSRTKFGTIVVSSGYGDGEYGVYAVKNREGRVKAALVVFDKMDYRDWEDLQQAVEEEDRCQDCGYDDCKCDDEDGCSQCGNDDCECGRDD